MLKKTIQHTVASNHADMKESIEIIRKMDDAVDSTPIDFNAINEVLYTITSPQFKYPTMEPCCNNCPGPEKNKIWAKAFDIMKTMEGVTDPDELLFIYDMARLHILNTADIPKYPWVK